MTTEDDVWISEIRSRITIDSVSGVAKSILPENDFVVVFPFLKKVFLPSWFATQAELFLFKYYKIGSKTEDSHPFADILGNTLSYYLECTLFTFAHILKTLPYGWFKDNPQYVERLRNGIWFENTLFELEMFALLKNSGFKIDPDYKTSHGKDVEAYIEKDRIGFLVECKSLGESEAYKEIHKLLSEKIMVPWFDPKIKGIIVTFKVYPTESEIFEVAALLNDYKASTRITKITSNYTLEINDELKKRTLICPGPMEARAKNTLDKVLGKLKNVSTPCIVLLKCTNPIALKGCIETVKKCLSVKKYNKIRQVLVVVKRKKDMEIIDGQVAKLSSEKSGFTYEMWPILNPNINNSPRLSFIKTGFEINN